MMDPADEKSPLTSSSGSKQPDYDAVFGAANSDDKNVKFTQHTVVGEFRNPKRFTWAEWVMLIVATPSLLGVLGITIERFIYFEKTFYNLTVEDNGTNIAASCNKWICTTDFIFTVILLINLLFCAFYCYDGIFRERPFEMLGYAAGVIVIILYVIINYGANKSRGEAVRVVRLVLVCVFGPMNVIMAVICWKKMGYLIFNTIGSNPELIRAYRCQSFFLTLLYFNLQILVNVFVLAWSREGELLPLAEKIILGILTAYIIAVIIVGWIAVFSELKFLAICWYLLMGPCLAYYVYKLIHVSVIWSRFEKEYTEYYHDGHDPSHADFKYVGATLLVACILGIAVVVVLVIFMIIAQINFGKGLKEKVKPPYKRFIQAK